MLMTILKTFYALAKYPLWACAILAGFLDSDGYPEYYV